MYASQRDSTQYSSAVALRGRAHPTYNTEYQQPDVMLVGDHNAQNLVSDEQNPDDIGIEPIDLEEVQKINERMPVSDPNAPVGSNKNPIRIIQQGNQYITTQDVSDEHLQQIIQVSDFILDSNL
ncbi:unnamed protein product [Protopolystoma xenopodis]|uniref:Uncharacterized protein n=1 Tax=Protopolystoma xenopodis TaxID=117903 RepID=A0A448WTP3_9PLAT|nr:unnamed protein product [Protopolystoma xenopodis]